MILLSKPDHGCIYTLDENTHEVYYAPIMEGNIIHLEEFAPVDIVDVDDEIQIHQIQQELITLTNSNK